MSVTYSDISRRGRGATQFYYFTVNTVEPFTVLIEKPAAYALAARHGIPREAERAPVRVLRTYQPEIVQIALGLRRPRGTSVRITAADVAG